MSRVSGKVIAAVLTAAWMTGTWGGNTAFAQDAVGDKTEKLLKAAGLDFRKPKEGIFRVLIETKEGTSVIIIEEKKANWKDAKGNDVLYAYIWSEILPLPSGFKAPTAMLQQLAETNDRVRFGSVGLGKNPDGTGALYRNGNLFLRNADAEDLASMVFITHFDRLGYQKAFRGFLEEK